MVVVIGFLIPSKLKEILLRLKFPVSRVLLARRVRDCKSSALDGVGQLQRLVRENAAQPHY